MGQDLFPEKKEQHIHYHYHLDSQALPRGTGQDPRPALPSAPVYQYPHHSKEEELKLLQAVKELQKGIADAKSYCKLAGDPSKLKEFKQKSLEVYIQRLKEIQKGRTRPPMTGPRVNLVVGLPKAGKSSLLNSLFGLQLAVGLGETTLQPTVAVATQDSVVYDTPGENEDFNTSNVEQMFFLMDADSVFLLFQGSLKTSKQMVQILCSVRPASAIVLVRTKCDQVEQSHKKTIEQELVADRQLLADWGFPQAVLLATSAKKDLPGNAVLKQLLLAGRTCAPRN